jgi:hypothetical protein
MSRRPVCWHVVPAKAGTQCLCKELTTLDFRLRGNDGESIEDAAC